MPTDTKQSIVAGLASAIIFFTVLQLGLGSFFLFLPSLPLFYVGLSRGGRTVLTGSAIAATLIGVIGAPTVGVSFFLVVGLPVWYFANRSLRCTGDGDTTVWFPLGLILLNLTVAACAMLGVLTLQLALQPENLPTVITAYVRTAFAPLKAEFGDAVEMLAVQWSFLSLSITVWVWGSAIYLHAWAANLLLKRRYRHIRPDMAITPFVMPSWTLSLLGICALASLIGGESSQFLGKTLLVVLTLPYFFLGIALLNAKSLAWPNRRILLFIIYFFTFAQLWPILAISAGGLWHQVKNLNKRLPPDVNSTKR